VTGGFRRRADFRADSGCLMAPWQRTFLRFAPSTPGGGLAYSRPPGLFRHAPRGGARPYFCMRACPAFPALRDAVALRAGVPVLPSRRRYAGLRRALSAGDSPALFFWFGLTPVFRHGSRRGSLYADSRATRLLLGARCGKAGFPFLLCATVSDSRILRRATCLAGCPWWIGSGPVGFSAHLVRCVSLPLAALLPARPPTLPGFLTPGSLRARRILLAAWCAAPGGGRHCPLLLFLSTRRFPGLAGFFCRHVPRLHLLRLTWRGPCAGLETSPDDPCRRIADCLGAAETRTGCSGTACCPGCFFLLGAGPAGVLVARGLGDRFWGVAPLHPPWLGVLALAAAATPTAAF